VICTLAKAARIITSSDSLSRKGIPTQRYAAALAEDVMVLGSVRAAMLLVAVCAGTFSQKVDFRRDLFVRLTHCDGWALIESITR
jgi:hypothetical protein